MKNGGEFDIKLQAEWQYPYGDASKTMTKFMYYDGQLWSAEELGIYTFGYFGAALRYGEEFLCFGAGAYQKIASETDWSFFESYWDDPRDQENIRMGYQHYWNK